MIKSVKLIRFWSCLSKYYTTVKDYMLKYVYIKNSKGSFNKSEVSS